MTLGSLLAADQIIPEMRATERWAAIVELIDLLVQKGRVRGSDRDSILAALRQREETMSTGIGFGIAIPHAFCGAKRSIPGSPQNPGRYSEISKRQSRSRAAREGRFV